MRAILALFSLSVICCPAVGQGPPGTNLRADVRVSRLERRGDTVTVAYVLRNSPRSLEKLFTFVVEAPAPAVHISPPVPFASWDTGTRQNDLSIAEWVALDLVGPGETTPPLQFEAIGLPTIVTGYVGGYFPPPKYRPVDADTLRRYSPRQILAANAVAGQTVGVEPLPTDLSPRSLVARLRVLLDSACGLGWIRGRGLCTAWRMRLGDVARDVGLGHRGEAAADLRAFVRELGERFGREEGERAQEERAARDRVREPISDAAYWLLKVNAEYILARL